MQQPILQTTIVGSLPKPSWLAEPAKLWAAWKLEGDALAEGKRDAVRLDIHARRGDRTIALLGWAWLGPYPALLLAA